MQDSIKRNSDGTWPQGQSGNSSGTNGHNAGWQRYGQRIIALGEKYTQAQILEFAYDDIKRIGELSYWDGVCVVHMARAIERKLTQTDSGADHLGKEREAMISRIEGAPTQVFASDKDNPLKFTLDFGNNADLDLRKAETLPKTE